MFLSVILSLFVRAGGLLWSGVKWVCANPKVLPYLAIALLALVLYMQHAKIRQYQQEIATTRSEYQTAVSANQSDAATIAALQKGVADLQASLGSEHAAAVVAAAKASQTTQALSQRLSAAQSGLKQLEENPSYEAYLNTDLNAQYPELARGLRALDASPSN
jgi:hypothetical protein